MLKSNKKKRLKNGTGDFNILNYSDKIIDKQQKRYYNRVIDKIPHTGILPSISSWAEEKRYLPSGTTEVPGKYNADTAPHLREPLELLHPDSPFQKITMMKSVQSLNTTTIAENAMGFWLDYKQGSCLFLTSTKGIGNIRSSSAIDVMIDSAKLQIKPMSERMKRKTGDKANYKEFAGNNKLLISSYNSIADLKSNTFHLIICDEWDEAGAELAGQGDIEGIIEGRTMGLRRYKILRISTPSNMNTSRIYKSFMEGDQRYFNAPCFHCGEKQVLELKGQGKKHGLTFTRETNKTTGHKILVPESVRYICKHCGKPIYESKKKYMMKNGVWIPTVVPEDKYNASFHSPGLISPFLSWERICQQFINSGFGSDVLKFKDFTINYMGLPWANVAKQALWQDLKDRAEDYCQGEVPRGELKQVGELEIYTGAMILFAGVDVQGDRLELHVVGFGANSEKWSIDYQVFYGRPEDGNNPCWQLLDDWVYNHVYNVAGIDCNIAFCAIDSGFDPGKATRREKDFANKSNVVYDFIAPRQDKFMSVMGISGDKATGIIKETKVNDITTQLNKRYNVYVSVLKEMVMNTVGTVSGYGTIHFPKYIMIADQKKEMVDHPFKSFLSEVYKETKPGKWEWKKIYERNEYLDTFNYAIAAADYFGFNKLSPESWMKYYYDLIS